MVLQVEYEMPEPRPAWSVQPPQFFADLICESCGQAIALVRERDGKTVLMPRHAPGEAPMYVYRAQLVCACGAERSFFSVPMSAVQLGIAEAGG